MKKLFSLIIAALIMMCILPAMGEAEVPTLTLTPPQSGEAYYTGEVTTAVLTLPGAEYQNAAVLFHRDGDDWATEFYFDDAWQQDLSRGEKEIHVPAHGGQYDVFVIAQPAGSAEWVSISEIDTLFIEIESCGPVDKMEIDVPLTFDPMNGLNVMMHAVDNAAWYTWMLYDEDWNLITQCDSAEKDGVLWHTEETDNFDANGVYEIVVPNVDDGEQTRFETGRCYMIEVIYGQDGWESRDESYYMCAADNAGTEPVTLSVKRHGDTEWTDDIEDVDIYEDFDIQISAPGATRVLIREKNGRFRTDEYARDPYWFDLYQTGAFIDEEYATYTLYAVAYYEDEEGNIYTGTCSNPCTVSAGEAKGSTAVPVISLEKSTVDKGEILVLHVAQGETVPEDEHEFRYNLWINDDTGFNVFEEFRFRETPDAFDWEIPTAELENNRDYVIAVMADRTGYWWSFEAWATFSVTGETVPNSLILPEEPVIIGQEIKYGLNLTDMTAQDARLSVTRPDGQWEDWSFNNWNGYYGTGSRSYDGAGVLTVQAQVGQDTVLTDDQGNDFSVFMWNDVPGLSGTVEIIAPNGSLEAPEILTSLLAVAGDPIDITFRVPEGAEYGDLSFGRNDVEDGQDGTVWYCEWQAADADEDGIISFEVPDFTAVMGESYHLHINARAYGYETSGGWVDISVIAAADDEHEVTLSVTATEVLSREEFVLWITAPEATLVKLVWAGARGGWTHLWLNEENQDQASYDLYKWYDWIESGSVTCRALAYYGEVNDGDDPDMYTYTAVSAPVTVKAAEYGDLPEAPVFEVSGLDEDHQTERGQKLSVTVTPDANTDPYRTFSYEVMIHEILRDGENEWTDQRYFRSDERTGTDPFTVTVPTISLEPGNEYVVEVGVCGVGCDWRGSNTRSRYNYTFTVTEPSESPDFFRLAEHTGAYVTGTEATVEVQTLQEYCNIKLVIRCRESGYDRWQDLNERWDGHYGEMTFGLPEEPGTYELTIQGHDWNDWIETPLASLTIEVTAPYGRLENPEILISPLLYEGEPVVISFRVPAGAENINAGLSYNNVEEDAYIWDCNLTPEDADENGIISVTVPDFEAVAGDSYNINVDVRGVGYERNSAWLDVNVISRQPASREVTLTIDKAEVLSREEFTLTVEAPGATFVKLLWSGARGGWTHLWLNNGDPDHASYDLYKYNDWMESGTAKCWALAYYGEVCDGDDPDMYAYTAVSAPVTVKAAEDGDLPEAPAFEVGGLDADHRIERGTKLSVTVTPDEGMDPDRTFSYEVMIHEIMRNEWNNEWTEQRYFRSDERTGTEPFTVMVPTISLEPGNEYVVEVGVCGVGCNWRGSNTRGRYGYTFTVIDPMWDPDSFSITDARETYKTGDDVTVEVQTLQAYGNIKLVVRCRENGFDWWQDLNERWDGHYGEMTFGLPEEPGTYELTIQGHDWDNWIDLPLEPLTIEVTAPNGRLEAPEILTSPLLIAGEPVVITFRVPDGAENINAGISYNNVEEDAYIWDCDLTPADADEDGIISVTVPGLEAVIGDSYNINVDVRGVGYERNNAWLDTIVTDEREESREVTLTIDKTEVLTREEFTLTVQAPGATFVKLVWSGDRGDWRHLWLNNGDPDQASYDLYKYRDWMESGTAKCWALAYYGEVNDGDDPEMYAYTAVSAPVTVKAAESGDLPDAPDFEVGGLDEEYRIERGQKLPVTVTPDETGDPDRTFIYHVMIHEVLRDEWDNVWFEERAFRSEEQAGAEPFTVMMPTISLEPGREYMVEVGVTGLGCDWRGGNTYDRYGYTFTVTEPAESPDFFRIANEQETYLTFTYAEVEVQTLQEYCNIKLTVTDAGNEFNSRWYDFNDSWDGHYGIMDYLLPDQPGTYYLSVQGHDGNDWIDAPLFDPLTITVETMSEDAVLEKPVISGLPAYIGNAGDFAFSFTDVEHAEWYEVGIWADNFDAGNVQLMFTNEDAEDGLIHVRVPVGDRENMMPLHDGGEYRVNVYARGTGFAGSCSDNAYTMYVSEEMPRFELTADRNEVQAQEDVLFTLSRLDREWHFRLFDNGNEFRYQSFADGNESNGCFDGGTHQITARAYETVHVVPEEGEEYDEERVAAVSNVVTLTVTSAGKLPEPVFEAPEVIIKGKLLTVTVIRNEETFTEDCEYCVRIIRNERFDWGENWCNVEEQWIRVKNGQGDTAVQLPTGGLWLADNVSYTVQVEIKKTGYDNTAVARELTVLSGDSGRDYTFAVSKEQVTVHERFFLWVTRESAESVEGLQFLVTNAENEDDRWTGDIFWTGSDPCFAAVDIELSTPGTYTITLGHNNDEEWTAADEYAGLSRTVTVEDAEYLQAPVLTVDPVITRGDDIVFNFNAVENAERYVLSVGVPGEDWFLWFEGRDIPQPDEHGIITVTIPYTENGYGEAFVTGGRYAAHVEAQSDYRVNAWSADCLFMLVEPEEEPRVTLSVDSTVKRVNEGDFIFTYSAPGAYCAELQFIHDTGNWWTEELDLNETEFRFGNQDTGHFQAYVIARYAEGGAETVSVSDVVEFDRIDACGHEDLTRFDFVSPTYEDEGHIAYVYCADCEKYFTDETAEIELADGEWIIPALKDMDVLTLPSSLTEIREDAFRGIDADAVIVPENCTEIGSGAFANCPSLRYVRIPAGTDVAADAFDGCPIVIIDRK